MQPFIELDSVSYAYPLPGGEARAALREVSLVIEEGAYVAVVGANGSGKSTLARHLNALLVPEEGRVLVGGFDTRERGHLQEVRRTVGMVFQRPADQLVATMVEDEVAFGPENLGLPPEEIEARVRGALEAVGMWELRERPPHTLSAGQMQRVALAGVLAMRPRCLVFDEATAMLDPAGRREVLALMARLHEEGLTVVAITHFMGEAAEAERVVALSEGRVALDGPPAEVFAEPESLLALGLELPPAAALARELRSRYPSLPRGLLTVEGVVEALDALPHGEGPALEMPDAPPPPAEPLIEVRGLGHVYLEGTPLALRALHDAGLTVALDETRGLLGATGSGKSTLMQHLNGLLRPQEGSVRVDGFRLDDPEVDLRALRRFAGLSFQMPEMQIFEQYVGDEVAYAPRLMGLEGEALRERVRWAMELVGLDFAGYKDRLTFALSGGEKRKVALASVLAMRPRVLLLDEPTAGLDPASRRELLGHLRELRDQGLTLVLSSHQMEDLAEMADRLTAMEGGTDVLTGGVREVFARGERLLELGLGVPVATAVAEGLRALAWPLPQGIVTAGELVAALEGVVEGG